MATALAARPSSATTAIPPLANGDRLSRAEFERRWDLHPEIKKAELIDGQVYLEMTVSLNHGVPHSFMVGWLLRYWGGDRALQVADNVTVRLPDSGDLQPDALLRKVEGGTSTVSDDYCVEGPPELVAEVSASSASYDLHVKKDAYERGGVLEYVVWQQYEERLDWFVLEAGRYVTIEPDETGIIESRTFPGLRLDVPALLKGQLAAVLRAVTPVS